MDFVPRLPIGLRLDTASGAAQDVAGMAPDGIDNLAADLADQARTDGKPWDKLVVKRNNRNLRVLNGTHGNAVGADFSGYFEPYVNDVWRKYESIDMKIDTQAGPGVLQGRVKAGKLVIGDEKFSRPSTTDVFGCNSGPFTTGPNPTRNAIIPRLAAAFVRSALLETAEHPSRPDTFYRSSPTNHYARLVHLRNLDSKGYAFAYDDVQLDGGEDQSGKVNAGDPTLFTVTVGGITAAKKQWGVRANGNEGGHESRGWMGKMNDLAQKVMK